jgi:hypothetical protein
MHIDIPPPGAGQTRAVIKTIEMALSGLPPIGRSRVLTAAGIVLGLDTKPHRRPRKPSIATLVKRAEKTGKPVTSVTLPDGTVLHFGKVEDTETGNPWLDDLRVTKQ